MDDYNRYIHYLDKGNVKSSFSNSQSTFVLCGYYWGKNVVNKNSVKGLTYGQQNERLIKQCEQHKVNYYFVEYKVFAEQKLYQVALGLKTAFILKCLDKFPKHKIILIDTDLQVLQYPYLFDIDADCFFLNWNEHEWECYNPFQVELPGGILGFANTFNARALLKIVNNYISKNLELAEDKSMSGIISRHSLGTYLRCCWLPYNYMYMFSNHVYDPKMGKYTSIVNLNDDIKDENYTLKDIVIIHEDFETGNLEDVFKARITKNRWPPNVYRQLGEKLRCFKVKFWNYSNYNQTTQQYMHLRTDAESREKEKICSIREIQRIKNKLTDYYTTILQKDLSRTSNFVVISLCDKHTPNERIFEFIDACNHMDINYIIYVASKPLKTVSKPVLIKSAMQHKRNVVYMDINYDMRRYPELFKVKNMDFMTINLNNTQVKNYPLCSDTRILKTVNDNLYFFANNHVVADFLGIWHEHNKNLNCQHKNLEYAFNISLSLNKMRCWWLPKDYLLGPTLRSAGEMKSFLNNKYKLKKHLHLSKLLPQCGLKKPLKDGDALPEHHRGSKRGTVSHQIYKHLFLQF